MSLCGSAPLAAWHCRPSAGWRPALNPDPAAWGISRFLLQVCTPAKSGADAVLRRSLTIALSGITGCGFSAGRFVPLKSRTGSPCSLDAYTGLLAILSGGLPCSQLSGPCSNPAVFRFPFFPTSRCHHDLSMSQLRPLIHSFIQVPAICWVPRRHCARGWLQWRTRHSLCSFLEKHNALRSVWETIISSICVIVFFKSPMVPN